MRHKYNAQSDKERHLDIGKAKQDKNVEVTVLFVYKDKRGLNMNNMIP